ncbi:MAG TPA: carboxylesterase/lipase family protein [Rhizomicrobium sp.]
MERRADQTEAAIVETACGKLAGSRRGGIFSFKGVAFAKPPVGISRWRMAEPSLPWSGIRDATRYGPVCPQAATRIEALTGGVMGPQSEDCLHLNIWTPGCDAAKRPVMVWIHGGAFVLGAGSQSTYCGARLAAHDVVIVTINYRLGAFGFLDLADATDGRAAGTGAEGLGDQIVALDWVKRNIAAFGGNPDNVTLFGESAGAMSVAALLASPPARGLFHKAIAQSGAAHIGYDRERAARIARAFLDALGLAANEAARLPEIPADVILKAQIALLTAARSGRDKRKLGALPFQPTIDGTVLDRRLIEAVRAGTARDIALLTGTTREEWKLFTAVDPRLRLLSARGLVERVTRLSPETAPAMLAAYDRGSPFERFNVIMTDKGFTVPMTRLLEAQAPHAAAYAYRFDRRSPLLGGIMGSCHALELGFVFGTHGQGLAKAFFGAGPAAEALASAMMDCWTAFARSGNPATETTGAWPCYDAAKDVMIFGDGAPHGLRAPNAERLRLWDEFPELRLGP